MARKTSFSEWINAIRFSPNERSPYWNMHEDGKGFYGSVQDGGVHNWGGAGLNRARGTSARYLDLILDKAEFTDEYHFTCPKGEYVQECWYDPKNMFLKMACKKSRNGKGKYPGVPDGNIVIYDHVPRNVFDYLKSIAEATGHCGKEVWDILRVRGFQNQSKYPYTDREG